MPGTHPTSPNILVGGHQWEYPPNIITYFRILQTNISRSCPMTAFNDVFYSLLCAKKSKICHRIDPNPMHWGSGPSHPRNLRQRNAAQISLCTSDAWCVTVDHDFQTPFENISELNTVRYEWLSLGFLRRGDATVRLPSVCVVFIANRIVVYRI